ncbi:MAG: hypothetical protein H6650_05920 [Ardenticatenales bacterium]|nr:hypothetical protein [Ardenticatenales bacterium]
MSSVMARRYGPIWKIGLLLPYRTVHLAYAIAHEAAEPAAYDALERARADVLLALDRAHAAGVWAQVRRFVWALDNYLDVRGYWG